VWLGATGGPARAGVDPDRERPLPWRSEGRLLFIADATSAPGTGDEPRSRVDVALRVPGDQLRYVDRGDSLVGELRLKVEFKSRFGRTEHEETRTLRVVAPPRTASGYSPGHLLLQSFVVPPGLHQLHLRLEDLQRNKRGLAYVGRRVPEKGSAAGLLRVAAFPADSLVVSPPLLVWPSAALDTSDARGRGAFRRMGGAAPVVPNPDRVYGLYAPVARAYFEVRPSRGSAALPSTMVARVRTVDGQPLAVVDSVRIDESEAWSGRFGFDVSSLPAGAYDLEVEVARGAHVAVARNRFNVAWRAESWERDPREFLEEAHFLLDDPDLEARYAEFTAGEQEAYLDRYWKDRDPTPLSAQNEERDKFYQRVRYANEHYGIAGVIKGMLSDRGRIYVRYGEPDEIRQQVMPTGNQSLQQVAREIALVDDDPAYIQLRRKGGVGSDERAFELWTYIRVLGSEVERLSGGSQRRMVRKFVFVDEEGYGNYTLRYSSE
jgi:GWxTD domain-containing protein